MTDLFDAIFGYYMVVLGAGAFNGARTTLRGNHDTPAGDAPDTGAASDPAGRTPLGERGRAAGMRASRAFQGFRTSRAATAAGWASGVRVYRTGRRGGASAAAFARRTVRPGRPAGPEAEPTAPGVDSPRDDVTPATDARGSQSQPDAPAAATPPAAAAAPTLAADATATQDDDDLDALLRVVTDPNPDTSTTGHAGNPDRPRLTLVPPLKEYPPMPSAEITDLESLLGFTKQAAGFAGMESEDALSASLSTIAAAEFSGDTAKRVDDETQTVEMAIAAMALLGVDGETAAAYGQLHEAGGAYRDLANKFAAGLQDLAALAQNMSGAASNYHEAAVAALDTVTREQMPHAEAAQATGHGGADGHFYGVSSTQGVALPNPTVGALPAGN